MVKVTAGGTTYTKVMDGNSGYLSHSLYPLYFGLGAAECVDSIEVVWPSGRKQSVPRADQDQRDSTSGKWNSRGDSGQRPIPGFRIGRRGRHEPRVEAGIRSVERVRSPVDRLAQIVDVAVDEAALHAAAVDDVDLVAFAGRDPAWQRCSSRKCSRRRCCRCRRRRRRSSCR